MRRRPFPAAARRRRRVRAGPGATRGHASTRRRWSGRTGDPRPLCPSCHGAAL